MKAIQVVRSAAARTARQARDRLLHPYFNREAKKRLRGARVGRILVLCHGNICRSPFLEVFLRRELEGRGLNGVVVKSAGFVGPNRPSPPNAVAVAREMGIDLESHRSATLLSEDLQRSDLVVVMSAQQARDVRWRGAPPRVPVLVLGDLDPNPIRGRTIIDPWNGDEAAFRDSYRRIERCGRELVALLTGG